jgi:histidyl-tRNA synthetase
VLVCWVDEAARLESIRVAGRLRQTGLQVEWYPAAERLPRQLKYADRQKIPLAVILGSRELDQGSMAIKDLRDGNQITTGSESLIDRLTALLE